MKSRIDWTMGFGGPWTTEKLGILEEYLDSYTTALKHQPFRLVYIDAFAGSGEINIGDGGVSEFDSDSFVAGSTELALSAGLERLDLWLLFPVGAIGRMLPLSKDPDEVQPEWAKRLNIVFGGDQWRQLYSLSPQQDLFIDAAVERDPGINGLLEIYKNQLERVFGVRFLRQSRTLKNSKNSPLFEFIFCVGSSSMKAIQAAKRIARHLVRDLSAHP